MKSTENKKRIEEIHYQWAAFKNNKKSLTKNDLAVLKSEAKRLGVELK